MDLFTNRWLALRVMQGPHPPAFTKEPPMGQPSSVFETSKPSSASSSPAPKPLALHGRTIGHGAPKHQISLEEFRRLLTEYHNWPLHDAVMRELIRRANAPAVNLDGRHRLDAAVRPAQGQR